MIARILALFPKLRRLLSRSEWAVRLLSLPRTPESSSEQGVILVQIDGLSRSQFVKALAKGRMPFLRRLLGREE